MTTSWRSWLGDSATFNYAEWIMIEGVSSATTPFNLAAVNYSQQLHFWFRPIIYYVRQEISRHVMFVGSFVRSLARVRWCIR